MRSRLILPLAALAAASWWCVGLLVVRRYEYGAATHTWLVWNLTLAWIPLLFALAIVASQKRSTGVLAVLGAGWLIFLPNAPYVLTDFVHLGPPHQLFDTLLIGSFAGTALALGFASVVLVQGVVARAHGVVAGWVVASSSLFFSSIGIYLGRVQRLNSWDLVTRPHRLWAIVGDRLRDPFANRHVVVFVVAVAGLLTLAYLGMYAVTTLASTVRDEPRVDRS